MKQFSIGVTTVYISDSTTSFLVWGETAEPMYTPKSVTQNKQTADKWDPQVKKDLHLPPVDGILRMED
jgi:hypothetical protein